MMRTAVVMLLSLSILLSLAGCGRQPPEEPPVQPQDTSAQQDGAASGQAVIPEEPTPGQPPPLLPDTWEGPIPEEPPEEAPPEDVPENATITFSFVGDVLIAQLLNQYSQGGFNDYARTHEPDYFLAEVQDYFGADDFTVVNLENVLSDQALTPRDKGQEVAYWFLAPASYIDILTAGSVEAVSVANNHTRDYGEAGFRDTVQAAKGAGLAVGSNDETIYLEKDGFTVAVICNGLWNEGQAGSIVSRIRAAEEKSDFQIVYYHGGTEGVHEPEDWKIRASRALADAGADVVLGNHPHVLQPMETYNGVDILYSLGNFCYGGNRHPENRTVIYRLTLTVSPEGELLEQRSELIPCYVHTGEASNNFQPAVIEDETERQMVLDYMAGLTEKPL